MNWKCQISFASIVSSLTLRNFFRPSRLSQMHRAPHGGIFNQTFVRSVRYHVMLVPEVDIEP